MTPSAPLVKPEAKRCIAAWLLLCAMLVATMVLVGGYTRLSGSGLSITNWKPIHGVIPPIGEAEWQQEFDSYKQSPQYIKVNNDMTLEGFKAIFWPEFYHRLLGRAIGIIFFAPLLWFAARREISKRFTLRLVYIFAFGGLQGAVGWFMVKSGLVDVPNVSHLRLSLHLLLAFLIFAFLWWSMLDILRADQAEQAPKAMRAGIVAFVALLFVQILFGAFMAGLHAGLIFNTFPDMNGQWVPPDLLAMEPRWLNPIENITTVQFIHRWLAKALLVFYILWWWNFRKFAIGFRTKRMLHLTFFLLVFQFALGVATLLHQVPLPLALAHQFTALVLFAASLTLWHSLRKCNQ